ncbi:ead/Ea22-like family protein [Salmonella enterica subsp. enterica]|nr:ead/Ea22-like family protein [Salmonella enterica]EDG0462402.1 ead/Ea22-like family protein [Salmonella enterica subsp. enterica serovar Newport]EDW6819940.1 ead/Ea22-like family protein [Salmonella enterica subsp. enterica]EAN9777550.1 ead/Ea22-like family protein [Salmonella enterica]EAP6879396.1 ead/Ea22-like family protein [Salmonella enterica]
MEGFLRGKCIPGDLKVNETNAEYLVRKFSEAEAKISALTAENELARKAVQAFCDVVGDNIEVISEEVGRDGVLVILEAMKATGNTPATDAFLAEVRAQGVEMAMEHMQSSGSLTFGDCYISLNEFAAELRKGGNQ